MDLQDKDMDEWEWMQVTQAKMVSSISSPAPQPTKIAGMKKEAQKDISCWALCEPFIVFIIVIVMVIVILLFFYVFGHITRWF